MNITDNIEIDLITFNENKRTDPPPQQYSETQKSIINNCHQNPWKLYYKIIQPNSQATTELNVILESAKQIFTVNSSNIKIGFIQFKAIIENAQNCNDKQKLYDNYKIGPTA